MAVKHFIGSCAADRRSTAKWAMVFAEWRRSRKLQQLPAFRSITIGRGSPEGSNRKYGLGIWRHQENMWGQRKLRKNSKTIRWGMSRTFRKYRRQDETARCRCWKKFLQSVWYIWNFFRSLFSENLQFPFLWWAERFLNFAWYFENWQTLVYVIQGCWDFTTKRFVRTLCGQNLCLQPPAEVSYPPLPPLPSEPHLQAKQ